MCRLVRLHSATQKESHVKHTQLFSQQTEINSIICTTNIFFFICLQRQSFYLHITSMMCKRLCNHVIQMIATTANHDAPATVTGDSHHFATCPEEAAAGSEGCVIVVRAFYALRRLQRESTRGARMMTATSYHSFFEMNRTMNSEIRCCLPIIPQVGQNFNDKRKAFACGSRGTRRALDRLRLILQQSHCGDDSIGALFVSSSEAECRNDDIPGSSRKSPFDDDNTHGKKRAGAQVSSCEIG